ncbi:polyprotein of l1-like non-ltr retrotransposon zorro 3, putative [Candida dubliniensis CD36]|uniref:Polyprotein of l1-like non-ltr retrotransposon zorro 3, putative n=1 Tax=Candida dubliniensis (strain CD36 / ATCC MYA-646 / CBS 7987 / NCPF 3949 / NRRL Y-17841) TaxID=573826 RepID=B9WKM8_CANDC|nr:polyprotein of l1-like non-ltr retrotransposon zorro 3, putative [Candida dubliniensis CD36]CAX39576.1 polyprotein of l1-like non-ltr retrotransposon zorro 3, putative [Candida dubliniensis CD36]
MKKSEIHFCQLCNTGTDSVVYYIFECGETKELWSKHFNSQRTPQFIIGNQHLNKKELIALNEYINEVVQKVKRRRKFTNLESWGEARCGRRNKYTCLAITTRQLDFIRKLPIQCLQASSTLNIIHGGGVFKRTLHYEFFSFPLKKWP